MVITNISDVYIINCVYPLVTFSWDKQTSGFFVMEVTEEIFEQDIVLRA